jgi:urocanate hydratase
LAIKNALRYFPVRYHAALAPEFLNELLTEGHIYMRRFRPTEYEMKAYAITDYPAKCVHAAAIMLMIMNNLDKRVAQFPEEMVTYGGNGSVLSNWAQYHLLMHYLSQMTDSQTLSMYSGHPAVRCSRFSAARHFLLLIRSHNRVYSLRHLKLHV